MSPLLILVILVIVLALVFDYSNGFHDSANSIATVVATRVLRPGQAVLWAAFFNFIAAFTFEPAVAKTIGKGIIDPTIVDVNVILAAVAGAILWNIATWYFGLPSSSSHALVGGLVGTAIVKVGPEAVIGAGLRKAALFIVVSPTLGMILGFILMSISVRILHNARPRRVTSWTRILQLVSSACYSLSHGLNDAQKTMGIIAVLLVSMQPRIPELQNTPHWFMPTQDMETVPLWIILSAHTAIALGTLSGGWRIVKTMGMRLTHLNPLGGFCAESAGALTIIGASIAGIPVSTTHTITGAIVGVGSSRRWSAVRWGLTVRIVWAWILTIPCTAILAGAVYYLVATIIPVLPTAGQAFVGLLAAIAGFYSLVAWLRSRKVTPVIALSAADAPAIHSQ
ncbi:MAG: inorganic phosphate transporter [Armatimonadetes bacterium]|nr:inorganic phosphate transporter [Armatimonadota bacterium]